MTSIFQRALGPDFDRLHPRLRRRFGFGTADGIACVGYGWMDRVWHAPGFTQPFLALGARRHILVRGTGRNVPFRIENYAYADGLGRETMTFARTFWFGGPEHYREEHWDATMIYDSERGVIVDYLGTHQHLAVDLRMSVSEGGGLVITSGEQRFHQGGLSLGVPPIVTGQARVTEWYDNDRDIFRIDVRVMNHRFGPLFGYQGSFVAAYPERVPIPPRCRPVRETART
jgi:hypothetical protein